MTPLGDRTAPVLSTELETTTFPDGAALRRWVRRRTRRHLHGVWALVGDVYSVLLTLIVVVTILAPYLRRMVVTPPGSAVGAGTLGGFATVGLDPGWGFLALLMLLVAVGVGSLGRLGPLFLRPHEAAWWLPMPGDRGSLLVPVARVEYLIAATVGATAGVLPAVAAGGGWLAAIAWPALMSAATCLVLSELIKAQILDRDVEPLRRRLIVAGAAACLAGVVLAFPRSLLGNTAVALLAGVLAFLAVLGWRRARGSLGKVHDAALLAVVARSFGAHVSLLSLDTRALGRLLSPDPTRPADPSSLRAARIGSRLPRPLGVLIAVAQADWILLCRQRRRLLQMGVGLAIAMLPLLSGAVGAPLRAVGYLIGGWIATLAVAEPARQAWFDGGPDASWPVAPWVVRAGHLLVPAVLMSAWSLLSLAPAMAALGAAAAWNGLAIVVALALVSGWAWAGVALRSGYREMPDFAAGLIASPMGSLPPGVLQMLTQGPDAVAVGALTVALVASGIAVPTTMLLGIQSAAGAVVVMWGVRTNRRAS